MEHIKDFSNIIGLSSTTSIVSSLINSITTISKNVYNLIDLSKNTHTSELIVLLERTDIKATIMLLQSVLSELLVEENNIIEKNDTFDKSISFEKSNIIDKNYINKPINKSIIIAIDNVKEIIQIIETELTDIHKKIEYNMSLYIMPTFRSYDCNINLTNMETKISILDKRRDNLFRVIEAFKNF